MLLVRVTWRRQEEVVISTIQPFDDYWSNITMEPFAGMYTPLSQCRNRTRSHPLLENNVIIWQKIYRFFSPIRWLINFLSLCKIAAIKIKVKDVPQHRVSWFWILWSRFWGYIREISESVIITSSGPESNISPFYGLKMILIDQESI